jgi:hypothetical protein
LQFVTFTFLRTKTLFQNTPGPEHGIPKLKKKKNAWFMRSVLGDTLFIQATRKKHIHEPYRKRHNMRMRTQADFTVCVF